MTPAGFPHSDILGSKSARDSPRLNAACHVLHRLLAPRHPPRALCSLTSASTWPGGRCGTGSIGFLEHRRNRDLRFLVCRHYPVVKVRSPRRSRDAMRLASCPFQRSAGRCALREPTDQGIRWFGPETRNDGSRTRLRTVIGACGGPEGRLGALPEAIRVLSLLPRPGVILRSSSRVVETRRLELLTLSLQRRCSTS